MSQVSFKVLDNLGQELVDAGLLSADQLAVALEMKKNVGGDLGHIIMKQGYLTEEQVLQFLSQRINIPFMSLRDYAIDPSVIEQVPLALAQRYHFMPLFKIEDTFTLAMADPLDVFAIDEIRAALKCRIQPVLASASEIEKLMAESYRLLKKGEVAVGEIEVVKYGIEAVEEVTDRLRELASGAKVVADVNRIIKTAVAEGASDIHIDPVGAVVKVRNRIDGFLEERLVLPKQMQLPVVTCVKIMGGMDIAERRIPQDGRIRVKVRGEMMDLRIATYPTIHGEKVVIRLFTKEQLLGLESLGFTENDLDRLEEIISHKYGIFLVSGPTGSGKTTTLYAALMRINSQDKNIVSIEDPIENEIQGVNQAQINPKAGLTFASALRAILRQDPDVIMVGEVRDSETADIAVRAAITGHLVFSTIHTNTAIGAVTRLEDLGVEPFMVASAVVGIMSQRLIRRVCGHCKRPTQVDEAKFAALSIPPGSTVYAGVGCRHCRMSGYAGRVGVFELAPMTAELRGMVLSRASEDQMTAELRTMGVLGLREQGRQRVLDGVTTVEEVLRVIEKD